MAKSNHIPCHSETEMCVCVCVLCFINMKLLTDVATLVRARQSHSHMTAP